MIQAGQLKHPVLDGKIFPLDVLKSMGTHFLGPTLLAFIFKILRFGALESTALGKKKRESMKI